MPHHVIIALGSNTRPCAHIQWASQRLTILFHGDVRFSRTLWTPDVKGTGRYYMNRLMTGSTDLTVDDLTADLKHIEAESGRQPGQVTIDLDVMQYDDQRLHLSDWPRPYIQQLIDDIL